MKENNENINNLENPDNYGANIDEVVITGYSLGTDKKYHMDHYLEPNYWGKSLARAVNSGYIDEDQIQMNPDKLKREYFETGADFRRAKRNLRHNRRQFNKARKYAGSDQQSISDRHFYQKILPAYVGTGTFWPVGAYAAGNILGAAAYGAYTAPTWIPWAATNVVLPLLGGEAANEVTRKVSNNKYNSFGDFVYNGSGLANVANGTFMETPLRFITDMSNPGYWAPYGKAIGYAMDGTRTLYNAYNNLPVKIKFTPRVNFRYRNIGGDNTGVVDLLESGIVRPPSAKPIQETKILTKDFTVPFFGHKGKMVDAKSYLGKWFVGAEDVGNFYKPHRNQWGYTSMGPLTINDVTINRRVFPKLTNSPYIEWSPGKYTEYNTPLKILQKNGFLTPNTSDNGFRLYSGIPIKMSANNKSYQELVEALRSEPFIIKSNTADDVFAFRRAVNSDDRFMAGVELKDRIGTLNRWNNYVGHGISKGPTEADNWANLRALLKYGIDKNRTFFQAPLQRVAPGEIHAGFGTASGTPYYDGPFVLVSPNSNPYNFTHVFINDSFENALGADLARRYKMMLQKEFPNIESLLYSEIK